MKHVTVKKVNAFVDGGKGGNPAGVVLDAEGFSKETKQFIAARVGFSETAFVSHSNIADFKVEFFTPVRQVADCGHATVATFSYLIQLGKIKGNKSSKEIIDGKRNIFISGDKVFMEQRVPYYKKLIDEAPGVLSSLGLKSSDLLDGHEPVIANNGADRLIVPLQDEDAMKRINPHFMAIKDVCERLGVVEYYVFSPETRASNRDAGARMFAPLIGIPEESATGMAAGPLACFLYDYLEIKKSRIIIEQGHLMAPPSPGEIIAELTCNNGKITRLLVGGEAVVSDSIEIELNH